MQVITLADSTVTSWQVPDDWNPESNTVECIGAGAGGNSVSRAGGGGGSYASESNLSLDLGSTVDLQVGSAGENAADGGDTWFGGLSFGDAAVAAKGGRADTSGLGGLGGDASLNIGTTTHSGGKGAPNASTKQNQQAGGGGGAAGPDGPGGGASGRTGGLGGGGVAGHGASGSILPTGSGTDASPYGGGGAAIGTLVNAASGGAIVISYEPVV